MRSPRLHVLVLAVIGAAGSARAGELELPQTVRENLEARVRQGLNVGVAVGLVDGSGERVFQGFGSRGGEAGSTAALDEHTVFEIGSITKVFTGICLADLVLHDGASYDDPLEDYLPDEVTVPARNGEVIRLVHLSTHRSGLPRLPGNLAPRDPSNPYADYSVEQLYAFLSGYALPRDVGAAPEYSNLGVGLLGHALSLEAGGSYEDLVTARVLRPLHMDETAITLTAGMQERLAHGHSGVVPVPNWDLPTLAGAGALRSTVHDMLAFLEANMQAASDDGEEGLAPVLRDSHRERAPMQGKATIGLGWIREPGQEGTYLWHNGGTGGYGSFAGFREDVSLGVVLLTNSSNGVDELGHFLLDPGRSITPLPERPELPAALLEEYAGRYELFPGLVFDVQTIAGHLTAELTGQTRLTLYPKSETEFEYLVVPATLTFQRDDQGNVAAVELFQNGLKQRATRKT